MRNVLPHNTPAGSATRRQIKLVHILTVICIILVLSHSLFFVIYASTIDPIPTFDENDTSVDEKWADRMVNDVLRNRKKNTNVDESPSDQSNKTVNQMKKQYDVCIVGAGLSGSVLAERFASTNHNSVLILEKRSHIGGNCYDYINPQTGIRVNKYGAHLFHTNSQRVWDYIHLFSKWTDYEHKVLGYIEGKHVPIPVNIDTINKLFNLTIKDSDEMDVWLDKEQVHYDHPPTNSEEMALSRVGKRLYELIFKGYTFKQWAKYPAELGPEVTSRIPVRNDWDDRYFPNAKYQALPTQGYTKFFENMILNRAEIDVFTDTDYFDVKDDVKCKQTFYTGPIDTYYAALGWDKLEYRSLDFEQKIALNTEFFQPNSVVNHPSTQNNFTRIVEYKHFLDQKSPHTIYFIERSKDGGEPYYPVPSTRNKELYKKYQAMAEKEPGVHFVGRLANYKYFNIDQAILNALETFDRFKSSPSLQ